MPSAEEKGLPRALARRGDGLICQARTDFPTQRAASYQKLLVVSVTKLKYDAVKEGLTKAGPHCPTHRTSQVDSS